MDITQRRARLTRFAWSDSRARAEARVASSADAVFRARSARRRREASHVLEDVGECLRVGERRGPRRERRPTRWRKRRERRREDEDATRATPHPLGSDARRGSSDIPSPGRASAQARGVRPRRHRVVPGAVHDERRAVVRGRARPRDGRLGGGAPHLPRGARGHRHAIDARGVRGDARRRRIANQPRGRGVRRDGAARATVAVLAVFEREGVFERPRDDGPAQSASSTP